MNRLGVIHNDLKSENVMIDAKGDVRIIDWGLAGISSAHHVIPLRHFMNNPVTFNRPFSTMIISQTSCKLYESTLLTQAATPSLAELKKFTHDLYKKYIESYDIIGFEYFQYIFMSMFGLSKKDATEMLMEFVSNYNADILHHFTDHVNRKFDLNKYFSTVYRYNTDVWGMMSIFYSIFILPRKSFVVSNEAYEEMLHQYRTLFRTTVFVNGHKRMNVEHILQQLRRINHAVERRAGRTVRFNAANRRGRHSIKRIPTPYPRSQYMRTIRTIQN
jgi:serine/threonine protein kinase